MQRLFLECAVRAVLIAAGTGVVMRGMRITGAAARHAAWAGVMLLMLLLPLWVAWGPKAPIRALSFMSPVGFISTVSPVSHDQIPNWTISTPDAPGEHAATGKESSRPMRGTAAGHWQELATGVYLVGLCVMLLRLAVGTLRARALIRSAVRSDGMLSCASCAAPVTAGWFRPVTILPDDWRSWPEAQLAVVLTHERAHVRRGDPLVQWVALLNRAVFWCHPLAWWLERRLAALSEEACDDVVMAGGHDPRAYSECLLDLARSVSRHGARTGVCGVGMAGGFLPQRIRRILDRTPAPRMSHKRLTIAVTLYVVAAGVSLACTPLREWARLSPFTATTVSTNSATVRFNQVDWELVSVNDIAVDQLLEFCRRAYGTWWEKRFTEDLVEVLEAAGHPMSRDHTVKLVLRDVASGRSTTIDRAPMTAENRRAAYVFRQRHLGDRPEPYEEVRIVR
jgi:hypothetical protein